MKTIAVVVTYNRCSMLRECLGRLGKQNTPCDVLVVDNASTDDTPRVLEEMKRDGLFVLRMDTNTGGAGGYNAGMHWAAEKDYDCLWLMDDDTFVHEDSLQELLKAAEKLNGQFGWLSSRAMWTDGTPCAMNIQRKTPYTDIKDFSAPLIPSQMASFVSMLIPVPVVHRFGYPIADFFIWSDDWEYARRISRKLPCYVVTSSKVTHAMKNNTVVSIDNDTPERMPRYSRFYRNDVYLYRREGLTGWAWLIAKDCWHSLKVIKGSSPQKAAALKTIWKGFREGISFHPHVESGTEGK